MKILLVASQFPPASFGGVSYVSYNLFNSFIKQGHDPTVLAFGNVVDFKHNEHVVRLGSSPITFLLQSYRYTKRLDLRRYDVIFIQHSSGAGLIPWLKRLSHPNVVSIIHVSTLREMLAIRDSIDENDCTIGSPTIDEYLIKYVNSPVLLFLERYVYRSARRLIGVCEETTKLAIDDYGIHPNKIKTITNGVDIETFRYRRDISESRSIRRVGKKSLLFVGVLRKSRKGAYYLIEAFRHLRRQRNDIDLIIVGDGGHHFRIRDKINRYGLNQAVSFCGKINNAELPYYYSQADVVVVPSVYEGLPLVILESLACGTPVATTAVSGQREVINKNNGVLLGPYHPETWSQSIIGLIEQDLDRSEVRKTVTHLNWDRIAQEYLTWATA
ncbi:MAG: glycosyltransferase family 4 protein [Desulfobacterales bacterium]|jgi:glycosyltransferase involved in cell wall biosynthesis|nr:glycosyltransferase family 4 protein [Desulfobacterales bacterium]MDP6806684.1 glycosyltransferase family 4 protein [Desulfobacterales bacterium]|tara:strand:+ start:21716 stop:22870 length:1155 start_codon:yes stop_codon:yes gene_type:complete